MDQIPYIVAEAPSNLLIKRFSPSKWQARIIISWGIVLACHCAVTNKEGLYTARFFLGLVGCILVKPPVKHKANALRIVGRSWAVPGSAAPDVLLVPS